MQGWIVNFEMFFYVLFPLLRMVSLSGRPQFAVVAGIASGTAAVLEVVVYDWLERPMTQFLRCKFDPARRLLSVSV